MTTKKNTVITADTEFVRSAIFTAPDGAKVSIVMQPYIIGMYQAVYVNGSIAAQGGHEWKDFQKACTEKAVRKAIIKGATDISIVTGKVGDFLGESDLEIANS